MILYCHYCKGLTVINVCCSLWQLTTQTPTTHRVHHHHSKHHYTAINMAPLSLLIQAFLHAGYVFYLSPLQRSNARHVRLQGQEQFRAEPGEGRGGRGEMTTLYDKCRSKRFILVLCVRIVTSCTNALQTFVLYQEKTLKAAKDAKKLSRFFNSTRKKTKLKMWSTGSSYYIYLLPLPGNIESNVVSVWWKVETAADVQVYQCHKYLRSEDGFYRLQVAAWAGARSCWKMKSASPFKGNN